jgi:hypothetical protein
MKQQLIAYKEFSFDGNFSISPIIKMHNAYWSAQFIADSCTFDIDKQMSKEDVIYNIEKNGYKITLSGKLELFN